MPILCHSNDIAEGKSKGFQINETYLFAVKKNGAIYVYQNACPHLGIQLEWQPDQFLDIDESMIQCSSHGALFRIEDGECLMGPCQGESLIALDFAMNDGQIEVTLPNTN
jgi:nitrite reductase/ring-hydroxylating ferredoxin subunit